MHDQARPVDVPTDGHERSDPALLAHPLDQPVQFEPVLERYDHAIVSRVLATSRSASPVCAAFDSDEGQSYRPLDLGRGDHLGRARTSLTPVRRRPFCAHCFTVVVPRFDERDGHSGVRKAGTDDPTDGAAADDDNGFLVLSQRGHPGLGVNGKGGGAVGDDVGVVSCLHVGDRLACERRGAKGRRER